ncbi:stalk domain-containing protein [Paenibacillus arenilitoris]|uniref:Phosphodiester glycosidase family protein n=1 Tax=Paenibacillus arenilitoris TaxID=2772299 RepID=A0A927H4Z5_9BACL|nr:stalk domain-containing protein [Paenibacillus arenilitoris]MBD2868400.1 phosphodiester glycosidase family protein [Paenibacillus arenilitoris]
MGKVQKAIGRQAGNLGKRVIIIALGGVLLVQPVASILPGHLQHAVMEAADAAANSSLKLVRQSYVTAGAKRLDYVWHTTRGGKQVKTDVHVIEVDLTNPYVSLNAMSGKNNSIGQVNTILNMAKESGAVAAINADVFVMGSEGAPLGGQITSGMFMSSPSRLKGMHAFTVSKDRKPMIDNYSFEGLVTAADGATIALEGVNQSAYNPETTGSSYSHVNMMYIYTSAWGGAERPKNSGTAPTEVLVRNGTIEQISIDTAIPGQAPADGYILRAHGKAATFVKEHLQVGQPITADYALVSQTTGAKVDPASFEMMAGGHTLLVNAGMLAPFSRDITGVSGSSYVSRSGVGYSKDGTKVYLITAEKYGSNTGVNLKELQQIMLQLGVFKGVNLDGGGSTTMIERPLGGTSLQLSHATQYGSTQRSVANGIGVFTSAPQGTLKGISVSGAKAMLIGQTNAYTLNGYDTYYNPIAVDNASAVWTSSKAIGSFQGNQFTATKPGKTTLTVKSGGITTAYDVEVLGNDQIASLTPDVSAGTLAAGATLSVPLTAKLKNGGTYKLSGDSVKWQFIGFKATVQGDTLTVQSVNAGTTTGYAIARYDGFATMIPFTQGETVKTIEDFETSTYAITSQVTPAETFGSVNLVSDLPGQLSPRALKIDYDFTNGTGTKASYAVFNSTGLQLSGSPSSMTLDLYGDNSLNWVRAEFIDAAGKAHLLDLAKQLDWSGWKNVKVNLSSAGMKFPVKLKRIYVVTIAEGQDERAYSGAIGLDNIRLSYPPSVSAGGKAKIEMLVGKTTATVSGKTIKLDSAPIQMNGVTYVPVRFVSDAMGAQLLFNGTTGQITVLRGAKMLEMTLGTKDLNLNGVYSSSDVTPIVRNYRTLIPVRLFSEKLGMTVGYDSKLKKITID